MQLRERVVDTKPFRYLKYVENNIMNQLVNGLILDAQWSEETIGFTRMCLCFGVTQNSQENASNLTWLYEKVEEKNH